MVRFADADKILTKFRNAKSSTGENPGIITDYIRREMPVHFGGMSDPFQPIELSRRVSFRVLDYLTSINYPLIISTKSTVPANPEYLSVLKASPNVLVQFSFSTTDDEIAQVIEPFSTRPSELLKTIEILARNGIKTAVRWQPYIPGVSEIPRSFVSKVASLGVRHLGIEHLKLPLEKNSLLTSRLIGHLGVDVKRFYKERDCVREGREFVLPASSKIDTVTQVKLECRRHGLSFGAADNEFQYMSDTFCCCSGADQFDGFQNWNKFNIAHAVKKCVGKLITFDVIKDEWFPNGAIDKYLNSNSRIIPGSSHNTVETYVLDRWENLDSNFNPTKFSGVVYRGKRDGHGRRIYEWSL